MKQFILTFYKKHRTLRALPLSWEGSPKKKDQKVLEDLKGHYEYKVFMLWYVQ